MSISKIESLFIPKHTLKINDKQKSLKREGEEDYREDSVFLSAKTRSESTKSARPDASWRRISDF